LSYNHNYKEQKDKNMQKSPTKLLLVLLFLILTQGVSMADEEKILAFGDSITFGYGAKRSQSYPAQLQLLSHKKIINAGIPGENSTDGLQRLKSILDQSNDFETIIICHGANDILHHSSVQKLTQNIQAMVKLAKSKGINVLLIGVVNFDLQNLKTLALYEKIAKKEQTAYNGTVLQKIEANPQLKSDYIHPNAKGYKLMASEIYRSLQKADFLK
jgi:lysophospholipase L1-like esterase